MPDQSIETIAAQATAGGEAAIALIRVSGPLVLRLAEGIFDRAKPVPRRVRLGPYRDLGGKVIDETVFCFFQSPHSYTGEDVLEISCHGNPLIAHLILKDLASRGCRLAEPGEFTRRAFLNGKMDLSQAEAVMDLIRARGERALEASRHQLQGGLGARINSLMDELLQILAFIEAYIDFPEEDLPPEDLDAVLHRIGNMEKEVDRLIRTSRHGALLRKGIRVLIMGAPNSGKSSLLNRLVGHERVLVSHMAGTTRDAVEETASVGGWCVRFMDTAGLRSAADELEEQGMRKTLEYASRADLIFLLLDATLPHPALPHQAAELLRPQNTLVIHNKMDLPSARLNPWGEDFLQVGLSALTGEGLDQLEESLTALVDGMNPTGAEEFVAIGARHERALEQAVDSLRDSTRLLNDGEPTELVASRLRNAWAHFGEITGHVDNEAMLDRLFAQFCIGK